MEDNDIFELDIEQPYDYAQRMGSLERMLYEDARYEKDRVYVLRENLEERPAYLRLESLARKFRVTPKEAWELREHLEALDATKEMVDVFARWTRRKGKEGALRYFSGLAGEIRQAERTSGEDALTLEGRLQGEESFEAFSWQPLGDVPGVVPWERRQPKPYQALLRRIEKLPYEQLPAMGRKLYEDAHLTKEQKAVAFDTYQRRKQALEAQAKRFASPGARNLLQRIQEASNGDIPRLGLYLYRAQRGEAGINPMPREREWNFLWRAYHARRDAYPS